jgi:hypothetical protein
VNEDTRAIHEWVFETATGKGRLLYRECTTRGILKTLRLGRAQRLAVPVHLLARHVRAEMVSDWGRRRRIMTLEPYIREDVLEDLGCEVLTMRMIVPDKGTVFMAFTSVGPP